MAPLTVRPSLNALRSSIDRVVVTAVLCALAALGIIGWYLRLNQPKDLAAYVALARTQLHSGQIEAAQHTCELAVSKGFDGVDIHHLLVQSMYARHDNIGVTAQLNWGHSQPDALLLHLDEIRIALSRGEIHQAKTLLAQLRARKYPPALIAQYQAGLASIARAFADAGLAAESQELQKSLPAAVASGAPGDESNFESAYLHGQADVAAGKDVVAQAEFRAITEHIYLDPLSIDYPLALLASARAYVRQSQPDQARGQFDHLLDLWKDADEDWPLSQAARAESDSGSTLDVAVKP